MIGYNEALKILEKNKKSEFSKVKELLTEASNSYYNTEDIILTDTEYDKLSNLLFEKEGTLLIGAEPSSEDNKGVISVSHKYKNLTGTLTKTNSIEDFKKWYSDIINKLGGGVFPSLLLTLKFDGNSVAIEYKNGKVVRALSRGKDGKGVDLTDIFKNDTINYKKNCGIKYEIIIVDDDFQKICEIMDRSYANARNLVSGMLGRNNAKNFREYFTLVPLEIRYEDNIKTREDSIEDFEIIFGDECLLFKEAEIIDTSDAKNIDDVVNSIEEYYNRINKERFKLDFLIDGIVIEILDEEYRNELGYDSLGRPNSSTALKFPYAEKVTEVIKIDFCYGDSGRITPRVWFKEIEFIGNKQNKQNLHNYKRFKELNLGVGSKINIQYRNECLSYVSGIKCPENDKIKPIPFTDTCPVCGQHSIAIRVNDEGEETFAYCNNPMCEGKIIGRLQNYVTKMNIKGIKENTLQKLKDANLVRTIEDLYTMDYNKISRISGLGEKIADMFRSKFSNDNNEYYDYQILGAMGIDNISQVNAKLFCTFYSLRDILDDVFNGKDINTYYNKVMDIKGFSEIQTKYLLEGIEENFNTLEFLMNKLKVKNYKDDIDANRDDVTLKIVFTGFRNADFQSKLEMRGHKVTSSVSSKTNLVVAANPNDLTVKIKNAIANGIEVIGIPEFKKRFNL